MRPGATIPLLAAAVVAGACHRPTSSTDTGTAGTATATAAASAAATATATPTAPAGRTYTIHLGRPHHVGERAHVAVDDDSDERTSAKLEGAASPKDTRKLLHVHLEGTDVVEALQPDGRSPLRDAVTVGALWQTQDGGPKESLARAGAQLVVTRAPKKEDASITIDRRAASKLVRKALGKLMSLEIHTGPSDDDVFGTPKPQGVGAAWPVNTALAEADLARKGIVVAPGSIQGQTTLVSVTPCDGGDCLELESRMHVGSLRSIADLPPGSKVHDATIDVVAHTTLPLDETRPEPKSDMRIAMKGTFEVPSRRGKVRVTLDSVELKRTLATP